MKQALFERKQWTMHSGGIAQYKIECDALTDEDIETLAWLISLKGPISDVYGVPTGGTRLAHALRKYCTYGRGARLIVDDVLTTGQSMEQAKIDKGWPDAIGVVLFARGRYPQWIRPVFEMRLFNSDDQFPQENLDAYNYV